MSASTVSTFGVLSAKQAELQDKIVFHGALDNSGAKLSLVCTEPTSATTYTLTIPALTQNETIGFSGASASLPSASDGQMLVSSGADNYASVSLSGDATLAANGAMTIAASAVDNSKIAAGANIDYSKLSLSNSVTNGDLAGSIEYSKLSLNNSVTNADLAGSIQYSKLTLTNGLVAGDFSAGAVNEAALANDAVTQQKLADDCVGAAELASDAVVNASVASNAAIDGSKIASQFGSQVCEVDSNQAFRFGGDSDGSWQMVIDANTFKVQYKVSGSWVTKGSFSA